MVNFIVLLSMNNNRYRILIIENSQEVFGKIENILNMDGLSLINVKNVDDGIALIKEDNIDMVLVNYDSTQDIGIFLYYLRNILKKVGKILIVYCLDKDSSKKCREALKHGADDFIYIKDFYELYMLLKPYLNIKNGNDQLIIAKVKRLVKENKSNVRVTEMAEELGIDRYKLHDVFQKHENKSVRDYISEYRTKLMEDYAQQGYTFNRCCKEMGLSRKCL
ncbi:hypothetical protein ACFL4T_03945, partial [candidate division KSB1 bacterium]